jgi:hypothetical protein
MSIVIPSPPGSGSGAGVGAALEVNRRLTSAFIAQLPTVLVLTPRTTTKLPAGGTKLVDGAPRPAQTMTLIEQSSLAGQPTPTRTLDGVERRVEFEIVAEWNAAIARYDVFTYQGKEWEVIDLFFDNGYEKRALVASRG